jgi:CelD/BcsL family acetyltransferase involved in cellulose biosynthesis
LEEEHTVEFKKCTNNDLEPLLNKFVELHQSRWRYVNARGIFSDTRMKEFYADIAEQFMITDWLDFSYLAVDGEMASGEFGYVHGNKFYAATTARDIAYSEYGIGHLHHMCIIKNAIENNLHELDFLKGDEPYKFYWTKTARKYLQIIMVYRGRCPGFRVKFLNTVVRFQELRQYSLREMYYLYVLKKKEQREKRKMGLNG